MERMFEYKGSALYCHHSVDEAPEPTDYYMHTHEWHELYVFLSGKAGFLVEGTEYELQPFDVMIMRKAEAHKLVVAPGEPYERIAIHFSPDLLKSIDPSGILLKPYVGRPLGRGNRYRSPKFSESFSFLRRNADPAEQRVLLISALITVLSEIFVQYTLNSQSILDDPAGDLRSGDEKSKDMGITSTLIDFVNEHLSSDLSLDYLCRRFYLSASQLNRIFKRATGSSVWQYICAKRLLAVREQIMAGGNVASAAAACGFRDYSSFYRMYVSRFGHPPAEDKGINKTSELSTL
jgi:AraC-like DNA-binding protein